MVTIPTLHETTELSISRLDKTVDAMKSDMERRFDLVDKRFDLVDNRFDQVNKRFDRIERRVAELKPKRKCPQE